MRPFNSACSAIEVAVVRIRENVLERVRSQQCLECTIYLLLSKRFTSSCCAGQSGTESDFSLGHGFDGTRGKHAHMRTSTNTSQSDECRHYSWPLHAHARRGAPQKSSCGELGSGHEMPLTFLSASDFSVFCEGSTYLLHNNRSRDTG